MNVDKTLALLFATITLSAMVVRAADRPNVVIIYGYDVGYGDVGVYGSKLIPTPNVDKLASEGLMFTDGHCSAATSTIITEAAERRLLYVATSGIRDYLEVWRD